MNYFRVYKQIVKRARRSDRSRATGYFEMHHVKPRCMGGKITVPLTGREHFVCHLLLTKMFPKDYRIASAFNKMFVTSGNQERYLPSSRWYEYRRKEFSRNHPLKDLEIKKKHLLGMYRNLLSKNIGAFYKFPECSYCGILIMKPYNPRFCSTKCEGLFRSESNIPERLSKGTLKECVLCGGLHENKYCCSEKCFDIYKSREGNHYTKKLSESSKKYLRGLTDAERKERGFNSGIRKNRIQVFDSNGKLVHDVEGDFIGYCKENDLPYRIFQMSYIKGVVLYNTKKGPVKYPEYRGWYAIRNPEEK